MKLSLSPTEIVLAAVVVGGLGVAGWQAFGGSRATTTGGIKVPQLSARAAAGNITFDANCAACHGKNGSGSQIGPPLIHDTYNPGHHSDESFRLAVRQGVRQHHWPFGDMPAQPQVSDAQLQDITRYVRELQQANGIVSRPHRM